LFEIRRTKSCQSAGAPRKSTIEDRDRVLVESSSPRRLEALNGLIRPVGLMESRQQLKMMLNAMDNRAGISAGGDTIHDPELFFSKFFHTSSCAGMAEKRRLPGALRVTIRYTR